MAQAGLTNQQLSLSAAHELDGIPSRAAMSYRRVVSLVVSTRRLRLTFCRVTRLGRNCVDHIVMIFCHHIAESLSANLDCPSSCVWAPIILRALLVQSSKHKVLLKNEPLRHGRLRLLHCICAVASSRLIHEFANRVQTKLLNTGSELSRCDRSTGKKSSRATRKS